MRRAWSWIGIAVLLLAACGPAAQQATATPTNPSPRATAVATAGPVPTMAATQVAPTPTPKPAATQPASAQPKSGGTLNIYLRGDPPTWDPHYAQYSTHLRQLQDTVFSDLMQTPWPKEGVCDTASVVGDLAREWRWTDDRTLEVKLTQGVKFQNKPPVNGREVTAQDVASSLTRWRDIGFTAVIEAIKPISKVEAVDRYTVRITNERPNPSLVPTALASAWGGIVLPPEVIGPDPKARMTDPAKQWIGSGPFLFDRWSPGALVAFKKNPDYFRKGLPLVDEVRYFPMPDMSTRSAAIRSGKLDMLMEVPPSMADDLKTTAPQVVQVACPDPAGFENIEYQVNQKPFDDVRVRRAISLSIDQDAFMKTVLLGKGWKSGAVVSAYAQYMPLEEMPPEVRQWRQYNPAKARQLLAEAGYPNGFEAEYVLPTPYPSPWREGCEALTAMFQDVGIRAKVRLEPYTAWLTTSARGKYEGIRCRRAGEYNIYYALPYYYGKSDPTIGLSAIDDPVLNPLIEEFMRSVDEKRQMDLVRQIQIRIIDQGYRYVLPNLAMISVHQPWVKEFGSAGDYNQPKPLLERVWLVK